MSEHIEHIDISRMKENISRLTAALEEVNYECQRLEIINSNLDLQLKDANRELNRNISLLQDLEDENDRLKKQIAEMKEKDEK